MPDFLPAFPWQAVSVLLVSGVVPFAASFVLDGVLALLRGKGPALVVAALSLTGVLLMAAFLLRLIGDEIGSGAQPGELLGWGGSALLVTVPLSLGGFVMRAWNHLPRRVRHRRSFVPVSAFAED
jgi:hypothetical protein